MDILLLLLFDSSEINVEQIDGKYTKILLEDYNTGDQYILSMSILWELLYAKGYIKLIQEASYPHRLSNKKIIPRKQQVYRISDKGKDYVNFKYPNIGKIP